MKGGHNRLPDHVKQAQGTYRPGRAAAPSPVPAGAVPAPPRGLSRTEKRLWLELAPQVDAMGCYTPSCYTAFRVMVRSLGMVEDGRDLAPSAVARLIQTATAQLGAFGLNPASAGKVGIPRPAEREGHLEEFSLRVLRGGSR